MAHISQEQRKGIDIRVAQNLNFTVSMIIIIFMQYFTYFEPFQATDDVHY